MADIKRTLNRPGQQLHSYSIPGDGNCAATMAISAKPVDHRSPPINTDFEETGPAASGGERSNEPLKLLVINIVEKGQAKHRVAAPVAHFVRTEQRKSPNSFIASRRAEQQESSRLIALVSPNDSRQLAKRYRVRIARQGE
jgi:hypothetical protein